jgi:NAD(P)-dependent dehydrogenase (short-subunit alcohol dehydrogenase family)
MTNRFHLRFEGKVALVTGAGQGIGQATAFRLAEEGAAIGALDRNPESAAATALIIREQGGRATELVADVADSSGIAACVKQLHSDFGKIDILISNAGFDRPGGFLKIGPEDFLSVLGVHLIGAVNCCRSCGPIMLDQKDGRIVLVSSIYGKVGTKGESAYVSAKAGLVGLTKSLAREWGGRGIRVNAILPGLTETPTIKDMMNAKYKEAFIAETPLGRSAAPSEIAAAITFMVSDDASFITGAALEVTGGWGM